MPQIVVNLEEDEKSTAPLSDYQPERKRRRGLKVLGIFLCLLVAAAIVAGVGSFFYWRHLQTTPQYSLALLVDAARREDQKTIDNLVDTDAVVDDFVPQITDKAIELYGRGMAPELIKKVTAVAAPVLPVVKERARAELPKLLRERTSKFEKVPFFLMAAGAERYLDVQVQGDKARVTSKLKERPLEVVMKRNGGRWQIVAVKDEALAKRIAEKVGQQIVAMAKDRSKATIDKLGRKVGLDNLGDLLEKAGDIFK
jgi:hypothetical protein